MYKTWYKSQHESGVLWQGHEIEVVVVRFLTGIIVMSWSSQFYASFLGGQLTFLINCKFDDSRDPVSLWLQCHLH